MKRASPAAVSLHPPSDDRKKMYSPSSHHIHGYPFAHRAIDGEILFEQVSFVIRNPQPLACRHCCLPHDDSIMRCTVESGGSSCSHLPALASAERRENSTRWSVIRDSSWLQMLSALIRAELLSST
jgi:hypothetical protein